MKKNVIYLTKGNPDMEPLTCLSQGNTGINMTAHRHGANIKPQIVTIKMKKLMS